MSEENALAPPDFSRLREHYSKIDFSFWDKELNICLGAKEGAKEEEIGTDAIRIYSTYLQLIEIFFINVFTITENNLAHLFLENITLRAKIKSQGVRKDYIEFFFEKWVFGLEDKGSINNYEGKKDAYSFFLKESVKDYLQDYDFLNAYKHGFRTRSNGSMSLSISADSNPTQRFLIAEYNSSITFLGKEKETIFEESIYFNWQRILQKCEFLLSMLKNVILVLQADGEKINLTTLYLEKESNLSTHMGVSRFKTPLYTIKKIKPAVTIG